MKSAVWLIAASSLFVMVASAQAQTKSESGSKPGAASGTEFQPGGWEGRSNPPSGNWDRSGASNLPGFRWGYGRPYYGDWYWSYNRPYFIGDYNAYNAQYGASYGAYAEADNTKARLLVIVPPDARVFVEDQPTQQMGFERLFLSPSLEKGSYTYTVRATWMENGQEVNRQKQIKVEPGRMSSANFVAEGETRARQGRMAEYGSGEAEQRGDRNAEQRNRPTPATDRNQLPERNAEQQNRPTPATDRSQPPGQAGRQTRNELSKPITGNILRVEDDQIIVSVTLGEQKTFKVGADTRFIGLDGQKADLRSLKPGMNVSIKTNPDNPTMANEIEVKQAPTGDRQNQEKPAPQK
jgi:uncharacterized protein (TIGR03000 family)